MTFKLGDKVDIDAETGHISPAKIDAEADGEVTAILTVVDPPAVDVHVAFTEKGWERLGKFHDLTAPRADPIIGKILG